MKDMSESTKLYRELHAVINRYMSESVDLTAYAILGALEVTKHDVIELLTSHNTRLRETQDVEPEDLRNNAEPVEKFTSKLKLQVAAHTSKFAHLLARVLAWIRAIFTFFQK